MKILMQIKYTCEKSPPPHEFSYLKLFKVFHSIFFHVNVICKKLLKSFFFFRTPTMNEPNSQ